MYPILTQSFSFHPCIWFDIIVNPKFELVISYGAETWGTRFCQYVTIDIWKLASLQTPAKLTRTSKGPSYHRVCPDRDTTLFIGELILISLVLAFFENITIKEKERKNPSEKSQLFLEIYFLIFFKVLDCVWYLIGHSVERSRCSRRTREINSPRRFRPLMRNAATPAGSAPFVQLFCIADRTSNLLPAPRYTASRASIFARRKTRRGRIDVPAIAISMLAIRVILDPSGCINQLTGARIIRRSPICHALLSLPLSHIHSLCARRINKYLLSVNSRSNMRARENSVDLKSALYISLSHYEVQMNFLERED